MKDVRNIKRQHMDSEAKRKWDISKAALIDKCLDTIYHIMTGVIKTYSPHKIYSPPKKSVKCLSIQFIALHIGYH